METRILLWIHSYASMPLDGAFILTDALGSGATVSALMVGAFVWLLRRHERRLVLGWTILSVAAAGVGELIKALVARPRPELWPALVHVRRFSCPSGHALYSAALLPFLIWVAGRDQRWRLSLMLLAGSLSFAIGVGRLYLGVHWPTDVLFGWLIGALVCALTIRWCQRPVR